MITLNVHLDVKKYALIHKLNVREIPTTTAAEKMTFVLKRAMIIVAIFALAIVPLSVI